MAAPPNAKGQRKGGIRQRLAASAVCEQEEQSALSTSMPSKLARYLLKKFAWGEYSAQEAQATAQASFKDVRAIQEACMAAPPTTAGASASSSSWLLTPHAHPIEQDLESVATIGVSGQYSNKCYSDLMKKVEPNISLPQPHQVQPRFANPLGERIQEILLPREMLAAIYEHKATWDKVILPDEGLPLKFWRAQKNGKPLEHFADRELGKVIPLSLHGDEVPVTGIGKQWSRKMVNFSWHSLLSTTASVRDSQFFIWALFDKAGVTEEGDTGYRTLDKFFDLLAWSFESEQLEQLYSISALEGPAVDLCYLERLGRQKQMPSVMPGSPQQNLDLLWSEIKHLYHQHNTKVRYRYLNKLTMFLRQNGTPKLRGKAGKICHFADIIVHLWQRHMSSELLVHKQIHLLLKLSARMEQLITDNREEIAFPAPEARKFAKACQEMLSLHAALANHFAEEETDLFTLTSKCHMLQHISLLAGCINPRLVWCFSGEDMQNRVQQLAQASVKGNNAASAVNKIVRHYRLAMQIAFMDHEDEI
ncbi:unnamed protein product [Durusdinium trenchii]|uniref:Uncharacterized protein n=1 Tax=Durusdinium trenchii TaxID=1381693 RepID=A0ABP0QVT2_9DINO